MASEKEIAHHLYGAYEAYLDLKVQIHEAQQMRADQLEEALSQIPEPAFEQVDQGKGKKEQKDHSIGKKKPLPTVEDHELKVERDLDLLGQKIQALVQLLTQNHTTSPTMLGEFENLRTFKVLSGEGFALNSVLPLKPKR